MSGWPVAAMFGGLIVLDLTLALWPRSESKGSKSESDRSS